MPSLFDTVAPPAMLAVGEDEAWVVNMTAAELLAFGTVTIFATATALSDISAFL
jgi:hypothetical protein